jgi:hypothetical protein
VINRIEAWIKETNRKYQSQRYSCSALETEFNGFYPSQLLKESYFVVLDDIPKPDFPELREMGFGDFIDMPVNGITYMNTYYLDQKQANSLRLHFHELVHVVQWRILGAANFISRYMDEIQHYGYDSAPLEQMAYSLDNHYSSGGARLNVPSYVQS